MDSLIRGFMQAALKFELFFCDNWSKANIPCFTKVIFETRLKHNDRKQSCLLHKSSAVYQPCFKVQEVQFIRLQLNIY